MFELSISPLQTRWTLIHFHWDFIVCRFGIRCCISCGSYCTLMQFVRVKALERYQWGHLQNYWELPKRRWDISKWYHSRSIYQVLTFLGILELNVHTKPPKVFVNVQQSNLTRFLKVFQRLPTRSIYILSLDYQPCTLGVDRNKMLSRCSVLNFYTKARLWHYNKCTQSPFPESSYLVYLGQCPVRAPEYCTGFGSSLIT